MCANLERWTQEIGQLVRPPGKNGLWEITDVFESTTNTESVVLELRKQAPKPNTLLLKANVSDSTLLRPTQHKRSPNWATTLRPAKLAGAEHSILELPAAAISDLLEAKDIWDTRSAVHHLRAAGWSLKQIGAALGVSGERARQHDNEYDADSDRHPHRKYPASPQLARKAERRSLAKATKRQVNGYRLKDPILQVPVELLDCIARDRQTISQINGITPTDDPRRDLIPDHKKLLIHVIEHYGVSAERLSMCLGYSKRTLGSWLARHGFGTLPPGVAAYKGRSTLDQPKTKRAPTIVPGGKCRNGHNITSDNMRTNGKAGFICGDCLDERYFKTHGRWPRNRVPRSTTEGDS